MPGMAQATAWHPFGYLGIPNNVHLAEEGLGLAVRPTGELDVFMIDGAGTVWHKWYLASGGWRPWGSIGVPGNTGACGQVAAAAASGRLNVVVLECDLQLQYRYWSSSTGWVAWAVLSPPSADVCWWPGAGSRFTGQFDVTVIGCDGNVWQRTLTNGAWSGWVNLGRPAIAGGITLSAEISGRASGEVDLFVTGAKGEVWHRWWLASGGWRPWGSIGEPAAQNCGPPGTVDRANGELVVAVPGCDHNVHVKTWRPSGGWSGWVALAHPQDMYVTKDGAPQPAARANGTLDIVARFGGSYPFHVWYG